MRFVVISLAAVIAACTLGAAAPSKDDHGGSHSGGHDSHGNDGHESHGHGHGQCPPPPHCHYLSSGGGAWGSGWSGMHHPTHCDGKESHHREHGREHGKKHHGEHHHAHGKHHEGSGHHGNEHCPTHHHGHNQLAYYPAWDSHCHDWDRHWCHNPEYADGVYMPIDGVSVKVAAFVLLLNVRTATTVSVFVAAGKCTAVDVNTFTDVTVAAMNSHGRVKTKLYASVEDCEHGKHSVEIPEMTVYSKLSSKVVAAVRVEVSSHHSSHSRSHSDD